MKSLDTPAIIYRLFQYSDRSAVAQAFSPEYGRLKLFMSDAYGKKGGFMTFTPGSLAFIKKESSDLHKFISFNHDPLFHFYSQTLEITMRMSICFDFFEHLFHLGEPCRSFWNLCLRYNSDNYRKACLYTVYHLMKEAGVMFDLKCKCGGAIGDIRLYEGELFCGNCVSVERLGKGLQVSDRTYSKLFAFSQSELFREVSFECDEERDLLMLFSNHLAAMNGNDKLLKSVNVFMSMQ